MSGMRISRSRVIPVEHRIKMIISSALFTREIIRSIRPTSTAAPSNGRMCRPGGLPMNVTISIEGRIHQFYFLGGLMNFFKGRFPSVSNIPTFATTLPSEYTATN